MVLQPHGATSDEAFRHWPMFIQYLLMAQLRNAHKAAVIPVSSVKYAIHELKVNAGEAINSEMAVQIGRVAEARVVAWGEIEREGSQWKVTFQVVNTRTKKVSAHINRAGDDLQNITSKIALEILREGGVRPTTEEQAKLSEPVTRSPEALDLIARANYGVMTASAVGDGAAALERAVQLDPESARAHCWLTHCWVFQNKVEDATSEAKRAIKLRPGMADGHFELGVCYASQGMNHLADEEFSEALRLEPDSVKAALKLSESASIRGQWDSASALLLKVLEAAPHDAFLHARLGRAYAFVDGRRKQAFEELAKAEQLDDGTELGIKHALAQGYSCLKDKPKAAHFYELFLAAAASKNIKGPLLEEATNDLRELRLSMEPSFLELAAPRAFSEPELRETAERAAGAVGARLAVNPLSSSQDMKSKAAKVAGDGSLLEKAKRLFDWLPPTGGAGTEGTNARTAQELFADWPNITRSARCHDYAILYTALARAAGLEAYYASVSRDYRGDPVYHACSAVILNGKTILVDPRYDWFGIPHQKVELWDDLHTMAAHLSWSQDVQSQEVSLKLDPSWANPYFWVALVRIRNGTAEAARPILRKGRELDSESGLSLCAQAVMDGHDEKWSSVSANLERCLTKDFDLPSMRYYLAVADAKQGMLSEARQHFREYLLGPTDPVLAAAARDSLLFIDEKLGDGR